MSYCHLSLDFQGFLQALGNAFLSARFHFQVALVVASSLAWPLLRQLEPLGFVFLSLKVPYQNDLCLIRFEVAGDRFLPKFQSVNGLSFCLFSHDLTFTSKKLSKRGLLALVLIVELMIASIMT